MKNPAASYRVSKKNKNTLTCVIPALVPALLGIGRESFLLVRNRKERFWRSSTGEDRLCQNDRKR